MGTRVVDAGADAGGVQAREHVVAARHPDDVEVADVLVARQRRRQLEAVEAGEQRVVARGRPPARLVPAREVLQLRAQHDGLQRVEPRVEAGLGVVVLHVAAVVAQRADLAARSRRSGASPRPRRRRRPGSCPDRSWSPPASPRLPARRPSCARPAPARRPRSARRPCASASAASARHRRHLAEQVHRDDGSRAGREAALDVGRRRSAGGRGSQSTSTGVAPARATASAVAMKVLAGTITSSPGPMPSARSASSNASVPLATPTQCGAPEKAAKAFSNSATSGPRMNAVVSDHAPRSRPRTSSATSRMCGRQVDERDARRSRSDAAAPRRRARIERSIASSARTTAVASRPPASGCLRSRMHRGSGRTRPAAARRPRPSGS